jgi:hypothetical protein
MSDSSKKKPIEEMLDEIKSISKDIKNMKTEITYIKEIVRQAEVRRKVREQKEKEEDESYVKPSESWFW